MKSKKNLVLKDQYYKIIPLALILLIVPCIVYLKTITLSGPALDLSVTGDTSYNFFTYYKSVWLFVFTLMSVVFCIFYMQTKKISFRLPTIFIPLLVFYLFVFLSSSFSKNKDVAFNGFTDRNEGFFVITCYVFICLMAATFVTFDKDIKILFGAIIACGFALGIVGISQFWDFDFFQSSFGKHIILSKENYNLIDSLSFKFPKQYIYSTLFNPNYVGSFFAMLLPLSITLAIYSKSISHKIITCIFSLVCFTNLIGSLSSTGYIASIISIILLIVLLNKNLLKAWPITLVLFVSFTVLLFWMNNISNGVVLRDFGIATMSASEQTLDVQSGKELSEVEAETVAPKPLELQKSQSQTLKSQTLELQNSQSQSSKSNSVQPTQLDVETSNSIISASQSSNKQITDFSIDKNVLKIYMGDNIANITFDTNDNTCKFTDGFGKNINVINDATYTNKIIFDDQRFTSLNITFTDNLLSINAQNAAFNVYISEKEKIFKFVDNRGRPTDIIPAESFGFKGHELWGSSRGYIWSRALPLIKNTLLIGHGPDTFAIYFPQNEFNAKFKYFITPYTIIDKPHNMFLQMAINTGVVSLVAFIVFVLWFIIGAIKLYIKPKAINTYYVAGVACVTAVVGYLVAGLANDSVIGVSVVFWVLLGLGIACNRLYAKSILVPATSNVQPNSKKK